MPRPSQDFWKRLLSRKIQLDILTIFIVLLTTSSLIITFYTYNRNYKNIHELADLIVDKVSENVIGDINDIFEQARIISAETTGLVVDLNAISSSNQVITSFLLTTLDLNQTFYSVNIAGTNGNFLAVIDLTRASLYNYYSHPTPLPKGAKYAVRYIDNATSPFMETWQYLDTDWNVIGSEQIKSTYDPRTDVWYTSMQSWPTTHWNVAYLPRGATTHMTSLQGGVTVSVPINDDFGKFMGIVATNLNLQQLSNSIAYQKIGKSGKAFILDSDGDIIIPSSTSSVVIQKQFHDLNDFFFKKLSTTGQHNFFLEEEGVQYLARISEFPLTQEHLWYVAVIVPFNDFFEDVIKTQHRTLLISFCILIIFSVLIYFASKHISVPIMQLASEVDRLRRFQFEKLRKIKGHIIEINTLDTAIDAMRATLRTFGRYIPKDIVKGLVERGQEITLGGERREITIMFSDIANFTTYSESLPVEKLTPFLAAYFDTLSKIIIDENGTIDKYIGDSIMVFWGAPQPVVNQESKACRTALKCLAVCIQRQKENPLENWTSRFGIHCGEVFVGNIGTTERMNYTVIGDTVNTAARLQELNKQYLTSIIITETIQKKIGAGFIVRPLDFLAVKGKKIKIAIYELVGTADGESACTDEQIEFCKEFAIAYAMFQEGRLEEAKPLFLALQQQFPSDHPTKIYLDRIQKANPDKLS